MPCAPTPATYGSTTIFVSTPTTRLIFYTVIATNFKPFDLPWPWVFRLSLPLQYDTPNTVHYILGLGAFNKVGSHVTVTPNNQPFRFWRGNKPNILKKCLLLAISRIGRDMIGIPTKLAAFQTHLFFTKKKTK